MSSPICGNDDDDVYDDDPVIEFSPILFFYTISLVILLLFSRETNLKDKRRVWVEFKRQRKYNFYIMMIWPQINFSNRKLCSKSYRWQIFWEHFVQFCLTEDMFTAKKLSFWQPCVHFCKYREDMFRAKSGLIRIHRRGCISMSWILYIC